MYISTLVTTYASIQLGAQACSQGVYMYSFFMSIQNTHMAGALCTALPFLVYPNYMHGMNRHTH